MLSALILSAAVAQCGPSARVIIIQPRPSVAVVRVRQRRPLFARYRSAGACATPSTAMPGPYIYAAATATTQVQTQTTTTATTQATTTVTTSDPYGFTNWLNSTRASYGLPMVVYDASLSGWAASNNASQAVHGLGHFVFGPARRQNSGFGSSATIWPSWLGSPGHASALLDPSITVIGISENGGWWTYSAH